MMAVRDDAGHSCGIIFLALSFDEAALKVWFPGFEFVCERRRAKRV